MPADEDECPARNIAAARRAGVFGTWHDDDLRRAFVDGAAWWEHTSTGATMWPSDRRQAEVAAEERFPGGKVPCSPNTS
jgi:hypothetical protein